MKVLQISVHFQPNVGGVETHLSDLVKELVDQKLEVFVLTYRPLTTKVKWKFLERSTNLTILRMPWVPGFFYQLVKKPILEFIYLLPGLFIATPIVLFTERPNVIHSHGLIAGFAAVFWGKILGIRTITTTHSVYHFPRSGLYKRIAKWIFEKSDTVLTLSKKSESELISIGINKNKIRVFTYWVDLTRFKPSKKNRKGLALGEKFVVLFVGRLVEEKGVLLLLEAAKIWNKNISLAIIGAGPLESNVKGQMSKVRNLIYVGKINNDDLPLYYLSADLVIVPSIHEEGFGRVILESLACGTPVIAAKRGAIPEAMSESVGRLITVTPENIKKTTEDLYKNKNELIKLSKNARKFAEKKYSPGNAKVIIKSYKI